MSSHSFWQSIALSLRHPTTIAALASVGMHATLGVALPTLPFFGESEGNFVIPGNVQLIELTPTEFARLPQDYSSPQTEYSFDLPNPPESDLTLPSFTPEATPRQRERESLPRSRPNLPPRPGEINPASVRPRQTSSRPYRFLPNISARSRTVRRNAPNLPGNSTSSRRDRLRALSNSTPQGERSRNQQLRRDLFGLNNNQSAQLPTSNDVLNDLAARSRESTEVEALEFNPPAPPIPERSLSPQELAARQREQATTNRIARLREDYRARDTNTTPEEAEKNQERWLAETNQPQARERLRAIAMQGAYPKEACINRARGTAIYGVVVQPNGRKTDVQQIRSTGYRLLDRQAIAQISGAGLAVGAQPVPYRVTVRFTYDASICPTLATPARPTRSPSPQPSAGASPSPSPTTPEPAVPPNEPLQKKPKTIAPHDE